MSPDDKRAEQRPSNERRVQPEVLRRFIADLLIASGLGAADADISAEVLLASDIRGIDSHGVPRLAGYCKRLRDGLINVHPEMRVVTETPATIAFDADNGMGHRSAYFAMRRCIEKAQEIGLCMATVRNSNHFGIAGYYAMMALDAGLCGVAMTNATPLVAPTFARKGYLSTAPIAVAIPAGEQPPIVIDMATSTVSWGKVEIARRDEHPIPLGWALDENGNPTTDPFAARYLTPLGATRDLSSQKGYGLALFVEVLCGQLAGSAWAMDVGGSRDKEPHPSRTGHAFMAWRIDAFRPEAEFRADIDAMLAELRSAEPVEGQSRVYIPGDPESIAEADRLERGIPVHPKVAAELSGLADELGVKAPF